MWPLSEVGEVLYRPSRARLAVEISQSRFPEDCEIGMLSKDHKRLVSIERFFLKASCWLWSLCWRPNFTSAYCVYPSVLINVKALLRAFSVIVKIIFARRFIASSSPPTEQSQTLSGDLCCGWAWRRATSRYIGSPPAPPQLVGKWRELEPYAKLGAGIVWNI